MCHMPDVVLCSTESKNFLELLGVLYSYISFMLQVCIYKLYSRNLAMHLSALYHSQFCSSG